MILNKKKLGIIASVAFFALAMVLAFVYKNFFSRVEVFSSGKSLGVYSSVHNFNLSLIHI